MASWLQMVWNGFTEPKKFSQKDFGSISLSLGPVSRLLGNPPLMPLTEEQPAHCAGHRGSSRSALGQLPCHARALGLLQDYGTGMPSLQSDCQSGPPLMLTAPEVLTIDLALEILKLSSELCFQHCCRKAGSDEKLASSSCLCWERCESPRLWSLLLLSFLVLAEEDMYVSNMILVNPNQCYGVILTELWQIPIKQHWISPKLPALGFAQGQLIVYTLFFLKAGLYSSLHKNIPSLVCATGVWIARSTGRQLSICSFSPSRYRSCWAGLCHSPL